MDRRLVKMKSLGGLVNSKDRRKRVDASRHVLETYHESFLYGKVSRSVRIRGTLRTGWLGLFWHFVRSYPILNSLPTYSMLYLLVYILSYSPSILLSFCLALQIVSFMQNSG